MYLKCPREKCDKKLNKQDTNFFKNKIKSRRTFKLASSLKPISTESILSIFPSPARSFKSRTSLLLSGPSAPGPCSLIRHHCKQFQRYIIHMNFLSTNSYSLLFQDSSLAFCPAEMTSSKGRGAREDQCSCLDCAISAHMPKKHRRNMSQEL